MKLSLKTLNPWTFGKESVFETRSQQRSTRTIHLRWDKASFLNARSRLRSGSTFCFPKAFANLLKIFLHRCSARSPKHNKYSVKQILSINWSKLCLHIHQVSGSSSCHLKRVFAKNRARSREATRRQFDAQVQIKLHAHRFRVEATRKFEFDLLNFPSPARNQMWQTASDVRERVLTG